MKYPKASHKHTIPLSALSPSELKQLGESLPKSTVSLRAPKAKASTLSKKEQKRRDRKKQRLEMKKVKNSEREEIMKKLREQCLGPETDEKVLGLLQSSKRMGMHGSTKEQLKQELYREKLGMKLQGNVQLVKEIEVVEWPQETGFEVSSDDDMQIDEKPKEVPKQPIEPVQVKNLPPPTRPIKVVQKPNAIPAPVIKKKSYDVVRTPDIQEAREKLPIMQQEFEIIERIHSNVFTIISGETGSGKSTQIPQFLYENGFSHPDTSFPGLIGITQPRRVAAISLASRVAYEMGLDQTKKVGYQIRYDAKTIDEGENKIKVIYKQFMTDGILLKEIESDFLLKKYSALIIDEAHERSINTDVLLGLLSRIAPLREELSREGDIKPLKVIIMSATLRLADFVENYTLFPSGPPPVISIDTRQYPTTIHYSKSTTRDNYLQKAALKTEQIHKQLPEGNILIFVTGKREVLYLKRTLKQTLPPQETNIQILYSMLSPKKQLKVFSPPADKRTIVIATNVAETSLTIPNVKYVVDCGLEKRKVYSGRLQMSRFTVDWISKASADQRAGRAGRVGPGHCYRLYSYAAYGLHFQEYRPPEILQAPIENVVLLLKAMGIRDIEKFPFPTPPNAGNIPSALRHLEILEAIKPSRNQGTDKFKITNIGKKMAALPIAPRYSKMLLIAEELSVLN